MHLQYNPVGIYIVVHGSQPYILLGHHMIRRMGFYIYYSHMLNRKDIQS